MDVNTAYIGLKVPEKEADGRRRMKRSGKIDVNGAYIGLEGFINREQWKGADRGEGGCKAKVSERGRWI